MKDSLSWVTPKQAGALIGYTARHVQNLIAQGKLSASKEDGKYYIDKSELFRVFPEAHKKEQEGNFAHREVENARREVENEYLREITSAKDKEIEFLRSQLESFSKEKSQMLDAITHHARLLEHKEVKRKPVERKSIMDLFRRKKEDKDPS